MVESGRVRITGEAEFNADWGIASVCDDDTADVICTGADGFHRDPACSDIEPHDPYGNFNRIFDLQAGTQDRGVCN
jgi:hypothetical protein